MLIIFKCTAGGKDGWGNVTRLKLILKKIKKKIKFKYLFIINKNYQLIKFLKKNKILFKTFNSFNEEKKFLKNYLIDITIFELLNCKYAIQKFYKSKSKKLIILDDITKKKYISDILIVCQKKNKNKINKSKITKVYNSYKYFPVEKKFDNFIKKKKIINKKIKKISVFLGGGFYFKEYLKIAKSLNNNNYDVDFIIGYEIKKNFLLKIIQLNKKFKIYISPSNLPRLLFKSDLIISGGGYTKIESAYLKTPLIPVPIHRHQIDLCKDFKKEFGIEYILKSNIDRLLNKNIISYNYNKRKKISKLFEKNFSENGANKIQEIILNER